MINSSNILVQPSNRGISRIKLNEPSTYNALSLATLNSLIKSFKNLNDDKNTKVIIIEGLGKGFCAGHNLKEIKKNIVYKYLELIEGSSTNKEIFNQIKKRIKKNKKVLVILDSNHSYKHVINELNLYSKLVSKNSYLILPDTYIDFMPKNTFKKWRKGDNTYTALVEFLKKNKNFKVDFNANKKSLISEAINGYIKKIRN